MTTVNESKQYHLCLNDPYYDQVLSGQKIYDGRCYWKEIPSMKPGDTIVFSHYTKPLMGSFEKRIVKVHRFATFEEALTSLGLKQTLPSVNSIEEGVEIYLKFYKLETQKTHGVAMIELEPGLIPF